MDRLLNRRPLHSDGKLTIKALAEEAQLKRWILTHKHTDLQDEFRARVDQRGQMPAAQQRLTDQNRIHQERIRDLSAQLATEGELTKRYARIVQVLTLENEQLRRQIATTAGGAIGTSSAPAPVRRIGDREWRPIRNIVPRDGLTAGFGRECITMR